MKLSVMLFPFHRLLTEGRLDAGALIHTLEDQGVGALEPMLGWDTAEPAKWRALRDAAVDAGLAFSCLDIGVNLVGESEADRNQALDTVMRGVELCRDDLHCPLVLLAGSKAATGTTDAESRRVYGETLARAVERTAGSGVTLTNEDFGVYPTFAASAEHCLEVLAVAGPAVRFTFDNGNFLLADDRPSEAYALVRPLISHVHIKDFALRPADQQQSLTSPRGKQFKGCLIGQGEGQVRTCLALLKVDDYTGWLSLEVGGDPVAEVVRGAEVVAEAWGGRV